MTPASLAELLDDRRIFVCVGTGGVGKTTVSSALAVTAARRGRRALVLTIDPARRLADALGLPDLGNEPERLPKDRERALGIEGPGELSAMMLDMKGTFDALIERLCPDEETRVRILGNPLYQHISDALAGSVEYAAMEKVYELAESDTYDLIVLDTPPAQHALDFLEAPERLITLLDSSLVRILVQPTLSAGRFGWKVFQGAAERTLSIIGRLSGVHLLKEISDLLLAIDSLTEGFKSRAHSVRALLQSKHTAFLLIAAPSPFTASGAHSLLAGLEAAGIDLAGVVLNRVRGWPDTADGTRAMSTPDMAALDASSDDLAEALRRAGLPDAGDAARAAIEVTRDYARQVEADANQARPIMATTLQQGQLFVSLPALPGDIDEVRALGALADALLEAESIESERPNVASADGEGTA